MESNNCNCCQEPLCQCCGKCHNPICVGKEYCIAIFTEEGLTPEEVRANHIENHLKSFIECTKEDLPTKSQQEIIDKYSNKFKYMSKEEIKQQVLKDADNPNIYYSQGVRDYVKDNTEAPKDKTNKPSWWLFPYEEAEEVRKVFEHGASKYHAPFTYRQGTGVPLNDLWDATKRHLLELHANGHYHYDTESQCLTWAHIAANALMAIAAINLKQGK